jgi:two-component system chemotaxis response regulator CheB
VIGASAGGVFALQTLLAAVPPDLPAAVLINVHFNPESHSELPVIFGRGSALDVDWAGD